MHSKPEIFLTKCLIFNLNGLNSCHLFCILCSFIENLYWRFQNKFDYDETEDDTEYWPDEILETLLSQQKTNAEEKSGEEETEDYEKTFSRKYKYPRYDFSETDDSTDSEREKVNNTKEESGGKNIDFLVKSLKDAMPHWKELYTEGGVVQSENDNDDEEEEVEEDENDEGNEIVF